MRASEPRSEKRAPPSSRTPSGWTHNERIELSRRELSAEPTVITKSHLVGIAASMGLFGLFGIFLGNLTVVFAGLGFDDPVADLATGSTALPVSDITEPFGLAPTDIGLSETAAIVLPGIPVTFSIAGESIGVGDLTVAQVFGGGGAVFGLLLGIYYAIDIAREQRREAASPDDAASTE